MHKLEIITRRSVRYRLMPAPDGFRVITATDVNLADALQIYAVNPQTAEMVSLFNGQLLTRFRGHKDRSSSYRIELRRPRRKIKSIQVATIVWCAYHGVPIEECPKLVVIDKRMPPCITNIKIK